jgi:hypothetical protein
MRLRASLAALAFAGTLAATPALAHGPRVMAMPPYAGPMYWGGRYGGWNGSWQQPWVIQPGEPERAAAPEGPPPQDRDAWLAECRHRLGDNGVGGAVIGGVLGGVAGNVIAGSGEKVLGTVAGAAVGAVAGAAIDKAEDKGRVRDRCEAMLESGPTYAGGYPGYGYGYGYSPAMMMVPVMMVPMQGAPQGKPNCKEIVTTREVVSYVPVRSRYIPRRAPDKRVRIVPDKRVPQ